MEKPILFSGEMVRAILAGRKTMTRRVMPGALWIAPDGNLKYVDRRGIRPPLDACPYGKVGDTLWVRESLHLGDDNVWRYSADDEIVCCGEAGIAWAHHKDGHHCPSIHMPRWASRLTLPVTGVRVERLQDISEDEMLAEGIESDPDISAWLKFASLWNSLNEARGYGWDENPWVWVIEFSRHGEV